MPEDDGLEGFESNAEFIRRLSRDFTAERWLSSFEDMHRVFRHYMTSRHGGRVQELVDGMNNYASVFELTIPAYDRISFFKSGIARLARAVASTTNQVISERGFSWLSTAAITRVKVASPGANLKTGSRLIVYGLP